MSSKSIKLNIMASSECGKLPPAKLPAHSEEAKKKRRDMCSYFLTPP
jgi:hypothetical protein